MTSFAAVIVERRGLAALAGRLVLSRMPLHFALRALDVREASLQRLDCRFVLCSTIIARSAYESIGVIVAANLDTVYLHVFRVEASGHQHLWAARK